ncbi:hypothetical protein N752_27540 [Desulforamulus aquiferis]|nr:hypothetical protein N752_27540 [Desulforamulus aquiferis]
MEGISSELWLKVASGQRELIQVIESQLMQYPGKTLVKLFNPENREVQVLGQSLCITPAPDLRNVLIKILGPDSVKLRCSLNAYSQTAATLDTGVRDNRFNYRTRITKKEPGKIAEQESRKKSTEEAFNPMPIRFPRVYFRSRCKKHHMYQLVTLPVPLV